MCFKKCKAAQSCGIPLLYHLLVRLLERKKDKIIPVNGLYFMSVFLQSNHM